MTMHMSAKFEANYLYLSDGETLSRVKQKLEDEYPLPLRMELNKEAGTLEISCDEYGDYPVQFIWNLMNLEDFALSNGIKHYCGYGEWTSGEMGERYPFEVMELTEEQKKKYRNWVQQCTPEPVNQTVVGALIGKNIAQCNELPKGYWTPVKYSDHFLSFEVTLEQKEEFEQYIRRLPFEVDYAYYAYSYSDDSNDTYGPYHYQKNSKDEDVKKYIDSLDYLLEIDKFCLEYAKCQLDDMLVPCDASVLPELYEINLEEIGYEIKEYYSSSLAVLIGENIKIPSGSPLRQQIRYEFKKDDKKVIILQGVITLNVELLRYYGVQEAVYYHFKETDDDTHPRQYMIDDVSFELLQQLCEVIERHILIKKKKGWTYKNEDFLSSLDKAIDDLYLTLS